KEARRAILAWLVRGCLAWQRERLSTPPVVKLATAAYREEMNPLQDFIEDRCILDPEAVTPSAALWSDYQTWSRASAERYSLTRKQFGEALRARGCEDKKLRGQRAWHGIRPGGLEPREQAGALGSSRGADRGHERGTDGTGRDATSNVAFQWPRSREHYPETD